MNYQNQNCYQFWSLAKSLRIKEIVALWCDVEPSQFNHFVQQTGYTPSCADAKKVAIEDALISGELEYIDEGLPYGNGKTWMGGDIEELLQKNKLRVEKGVLKEWFITKYEQGQLEEMPTFLDEEKQKSQILSEQREGQELPFKEMGTRNKNTAIKIMYAMLIKCGWDNTYPMSQNRGSANSEITTLLDSLELSVGHKTIGEFLQEVQSLEAQHPRNLILKGEDIPF